MNNRLDQCDIALVGMGTMSKNIILNMIDQGLRVAAYNRTYEKVDEFVKSEEAQGKPITPCKSLEELAQCLSPRRIVMLMVKSVDPIPSTEAKLYGELSPIDATIAELCKLLSPGDVIMDAGNTHPADTERRAKFVEAQGLLYIGTGVSGGSAGARLGPSIMPGGSREAWGIVRPIFERIAAKTGPEQTPCVDWIGPGGAGHYVKMVHNGIEYANMQLICEAYWMLKHVVGMSNAQLHELFGRWNEAALNGYLMEITRDIFRVRDEETGEDLVDLILDKAGAKGTGKWMSQLAMDLGIPSTLVTSAVQARSMSAMKDVRCRASKILCGPSTQFQGAREALVEDIYQSLYASTICSYAQGFIQLQAASVENQWDLNFPSIATIWREGCIIRAAILDPIRQAFQETPKLENLLFAPYFTAAIVHAIPSWRRVVASAAELGMPIPTLSTGLAYFDSLRAENLPANLLQAQRDYFGDHTFLNILKLDQGPMHADWPRLLREQAR